MPTAPNPTAQANPAEAPAATHPAPPPGGLDPKTAVVVIHGIGEQRPMETLRGFVRTTWQHDSGLFEGVDPRPDFNPWDVWSKPDHISGSAELRRITTARARPGSGAEGTRGRRFDFFEMHWADITADNTWGDFFDWFRALLCRNPVKGDVPPRVQWLWCLLWIATIMLVLSSAATAWLAWLKAGGLDLLAHTWLGAVLGWNGWPVIAAVVGLLSYGAKRVLTSFAGDVARYVSAAPRNIRVRQEVRQRGLKLLRELTESNAYDRVILVGHSLGSVIAHDLVLLAWSEAARELRAPPGSELHLAIRACERAADELLDAAGYAKFDPGFERDDHACDCPIGRRVPDAAALRQKRAAFRLAQRDLHRELAATRARSPGGPAHAAWLISDLITLGSPLTHAEFLIARTLCELRIAVHTREMLRCPPMLEVLPDGAFGFAFQNPRDSKTLQPHFAAAMGAVRWTNICDTSPPWAFLMGDLVSGPLTRDFGPGLVDIDIPMRRPKGILATLGLARVFTHLMYWNDFSRTSRPLPPNEPVPEHIQALRDALNYLDDPAAEQRLVAQAV